MCCATRLIAESDDIAARLELGKLLIEYESERNGLFWVRSALQISSDNIEVHRTLAEYYESHAQQSPDYEQLASIIALRLFGLNRRSRFFVLSFFVR